MSVLSRLLKEKPSSKKIFGVIAGKRLAGKTSIAGTLPGKSLLIQASILESGSKSAVQLAADKGNDLSVITFHNLNDLIELGKELQADTEFDNIVIDGLSAITELKFKDPEMQKLLKKDNWAAFRELGSYVDAVILAFKSLTYSDGIAKPKNVFLTCALSIKTDAIGNINDVQLEAKGQVAVSSITKLGEAVVTVVQIETEKGTERKLITKTTNHFPGRIDGILDDKNPGLIDADLSVLLNLIGEKA